MRRQQRIRMVRDATRSGRGTKLSFGYLKVSVVGSVGMRTLSGAVNGIRYRLIK